MYLKPITNIALTVFLFFFYTPLTASVLSSTTYKVISCYDGDTCTLQLNEKALKVRLIAIDAPEVANESSRGQPIANEATEFINKLIKNKNVLLITYGTDIYNRTLGEIFLEENNSIVNVNLQLIQKGLAEVYRGRPNTSVSMNKYRKAEEVARKNRLGIWSLKDYMSPYDYRQQKNKK